MTVFRIQEPTFQKGTRPKSRITTDRQTAQRMRSGSLVPDTGPLGHCSVVLAHYADGITNNSALTDHEPESIHNRLCAGL